MEIRQLEYFLAVVDCNGMNRAAEHLHVAQASLSQGIQRLERELDLSLFHRTGRNLVPTPAGELLVEPARKVLDDLVAVKDIMRGARDMRVGSLRIGTMPEMSSEAVAAWSGSFTRLYPGIRIELAEYDSAKTLCDEVLTGRCEIGFTTYPVPADVIERVDLGQQRLLLVRPSDSRVASTNAPVDLAELDGIPLITSNAALQESNVVMTALESASVQPRIIACVPNRHAQLTLVLNGTGSAFLPVRMAITAHRLGAVVVETSPQISTYFGSIHRSGTLSPAAKSFVVQSRADLRRWNKLIAKYQESGESLLEAAVRADDDLHGGGGSEPNPVGSPTDER